MDKFLIKTPDFEAFVARSESEHINIEFSEGYQQFLVENCGWTQEETESADEVFEKRLETCGLGDGRVYWEDRELFIMELDHPAWKEDLTAKEVAEALSGIIAGSSVEEAE